VNVELGVIADDLTGACDVAAGVTEAGMPAEVRLGVPDADRAPTAPCVIAALKSRTSPAEEAVGDSMRAAAVLRGFGARRIYQKYCSTFDSTDRGNIGPVAEALLRMLGGTAVSVGTPATPAAGRTVHRGHLFVGDLLLSESSLAHHPLTPMHDPDLRRVLGRQATATVGWVSIEAVHAGADAVRRRVEALRADGVQHVLVDAIEDADLDVLADAVDGVEPVLLGGAAGFAQALARRIGVATPAPVPPPPAGGRLALSGSGSERTRVQVNRHRGPVLVLDVDALLTNPETVLADASDFVARHAASDDPGEVPLVSATADPAAVSSVQQRWGADRAAAAVEDALSRIAVRAVAEHGVRRILIAGGETSGAVAAALSLDTLRVRRVAAPGVPWMTADDSAGRRLDMCLKSGNFGGEDFLAEAWEQR
jgi:uncharacterized protein YgbK (DUF1537 family)